MTVLLVLLIAAIVGLIGYTLWGIQRIQAPTHGQQIDRADRPNAALMIIDMQTDFTRMTGDDAWDPTRLQQAMDRIHILAADARANGRRVIVIRQVFQGWYTNLMIRLTAKGRGGVASAGLALDPALVIEADIDLEKPFGDSFSSPGLEAFLANHRIGALTLTGLDGSYCVKSTAHGALNRGYDVVLAEEAILAQDPAAWGVTKTALCERGAAIG